MTTTIAVSALYGRYTYLLLLYPSYRQQQPLSIPLTREQAKEAINGASIKQVMRHKSQINGCKTVFFDIE